MKTYKTRVLEKAQIENSRDRKKVKNHKGLKAFFIVVLMMAVFYTITLYKKELNGNKKKNR